MKTPVVAIAGNPNCGKTTLFNGLTGGKQRIGNWPGVTVEKKEGTLKRGDEEALIVDLPGIYSLSAHSEDEKVARDYLLSGEADLIVNIVDAANLERNLYLTMQLAEMGVPLLVIINRADIAEKNKTVIDPEHLSKHLGCPVIMTSAIRNGDIKKSIDAVLSSINNPSYPSVIIRYPEPIENLINEWGNDEKVFPGHEWAKRWLSIKLIEGERESLEKSGIEIIKSSDKTDADIKSLEKELDEDTDIEIADARYAYIHGLAKDVIAVRGDRTAISDRLDSIALNRILGIPIFLGVMYLLFWVTVTIGSAFIDFFDIAAGTLFVELPKHLLGSWGAPAWLSVILADGVGSGLQTVATFIPVIFTMFLMLSILEDSGYMARAAFVMDRFMRSIGLPGKSFVPMIVGFGCTVPAIMGTRTLESKKDRFLTIFMAPFMSCGAKLPVYVLFAAAFFPENSGAMVFSLYIIGIVLAVVTGFILKSTLFQGEASHFVMELPLYNVPRPGAILIHTWNRLKLFVLRASKVIVAAVFILALMNSTGTDGSFGNEDSENSVLAAVAKTITPVFEPMGIRADNWPASVSIFTGLFAKEAVVGTLNSLYIQKTDEASDSEKSNEQDEAPEETFSITDGLIEAWNTIPENLSGITEGLSDPLGTGVLENTKDSDAMAEEMEVETTTFERMKSFFTVNQAYAFLLFILLYFPCVAAFGAMYRETGIKLAAFQSAYLTVFAWIVATLFYQITEGHSIAWIITASVLMAALVYLLHIMGKYNFANVREEE
ncbi:MAG TPA: Fe(2+) transporter permease subunit FeoB [Spirochaetota bacterium]|nr:Fe(2+) transporter permease subunit FeoB [Spirochaetota bacterium]HPJ33402.1 Fe(2+) transporter permease subunit FeoB [Spirochaetota bacterium]